jgi:hypothetical protein
MKTLAIENQFTLASLSYNMEQQIYLDWIAPQGEIQAEPPPKTWQVFIWLSTSLLSSGST